MSDAFGYYQHDPATDAYHWTGPYSTALEIREPRRDAFRRLRAEVIARANHGQLLLGRDTIDLLNPQDRARFHQNARAIAASRNGRRFRVGRFS
jgi:hypothetical protein